MILKSFLQSIQQFICLIFITLPTVLFTSILVLLSLPYLFTVYAVAKCFRPDLEEFVTGEHAHFIRGERDNFPLNSFAFAVANASVSFSEYRNSIQEALSTRKSDGELVYHGLKRYPESFLGYPFWKEDKQFSLDNHFRNYDYTGSMALAPNSTEADVLRIAGDWVKAPWKKNQSPWEILLLANYEGRKTGFFVRLDHVLADGFSILEFFKIITKCKFAVPNFKLAHTNLTAVQKIGMALKMPTDTLQNFVLAFKYPKLPLHNRDPRYKVIMSTTPQIPVQAIKSVKDHYGVNYGAVVYAMIAGAIERALTCAGNPVPEGFVTNVVFPRPNHPGGLSIHVGFFFAAWPLRSSSAVDRLLRIQKHLKELSGTSAPLGIVKLLSPLTRFPTVASNFIQRSVANASGLSVGVTSMPVSTEPDIYNGMECTDLIVGNTPIISVGMVITAAGTNNKQRISFCVNRNMFASEAISSSLGKFAMEELQVLLDSMV